MRNGQHYTPEDARAALQFLDPGTDRESWVRVLIAGKAAGLTEDDAINWSATAANFKSDREVSSVWRGIKPEGGIGSGTLFHLARAAGWKGKQAAESTQPPRRPGPPSRPPKATDTGRRVPSVAEAWAAGAPATAAHPYIVAKEGRPDGLRVVREGWRAGWLLVPVVPLGQTEPVSLVYIAPPEVAAKLKADGKSGKMNHEGAPMAGVFIVGELEHGGTAYLCEGIGAAWACWRATGRAAVVCFGCGNMGKVAAAMRQRDASARLVLVADVGKETDAQAIAREVAAQWVQLPEGWPNNADVGDFAQREGADALEVLLGAPQSPYVPIHPLAQFVDLDGEPVAPRWVIPGFIGHGLVIVAGSHGVGKTTALLPLAMVAAGLHAPGDELAPRHWRHVVYIVEDVEQARRIVAGIVGFGGLGLGLDVVRERLHIVEARRMEAGRVVEVGQTYRDQFARTVEGVEVLPLVVLDTKAAVLAMDDENGNSEASAIVALLKQEFEGLPVWLVGHVAKANMSRADAAGLSTRGAGAFEADANQVLYLVKDADESRYLVRGKTRFEARWPELLIRGDWATTDARDEFGRHERIMLRWGVAVPPEQSRREAQEQAQEAARKEEEAALRDEVRDLIEAEWLTGCPVNREGVKGRIKRNRAQVVACLESLLSEQWVIEVPVPPKERTNAKRAAFLVNLTPDEHQAARRGEGLPPHKLVIPPSWKRPAVRSEAATPDEGQP